MRALTPRRTPVAARRGLGSELLGFALAGGAAYAADLGLFVWLRGPGGLAPLTAKSLSFLAGCTVAYLGNALGTYRGRGPGHAGPIGGRARRFGLFFAVNAAGALVQLACLGFSHYVLGRTSPRADVVSGAGVGMALATAVRFWGTRTLVFHAARGSAAHPDGGGAPHPDEGVARAPGVRTAGEGSRSSWTG